MHSQRVDVFGPPFVRKMPSIKNLVAGGTNVQINCPYSGYPIEQVQWYKDGKYIFSISLFWYIGIVFIDLKIYFENV